MKKQGKIIKALSGFYYVDTGEDVYECKARGIFRKKNLSPLVGDLVDIEVLPDGKGVVDNVYPRKTELFRPPIANIDQAIIVFAAKNPNPNLSLLDRFIVLAEENHLEIVICINKIEIDDEKNHEKIKEIYENAGYKVILLSVKENIGIDLLKEELYGSISVFAGPSGVGKSSILNKIDEKLKLKTGVVSEKIGRGKHTTRHAELIKIENEGLVADTPGFSTLSLNHITERDLKYYFIEFDELSSGCKFKDSCIHENEPGCAVKQALEEKEITQERYDSYLQLLNEIRQQKRRN